MEIYQWILLGLIIDYILGCIILALIDTEDQQLHLWAKEAPYGLYSLVVLLWPICLFFWLRFKNNKQ